MRAANPQKLDAVFHALADTTRRRMIDRLSAGPASVTELAQPLAMALPSVTKHLAVLETSGLVASQKNGRVRTYCIAPDGLAEVEAWVAMRKARWNAQFDRLDLLLAAEKIPARRRKRE